MGPKSGSRMGGNWAAILYTGAHLYVGNVKLRNQCADYKPVIFLRKNGRIIHAMYLYMMYN